MYKNLPLDHHAFADFSHLSDMEKGYWAGLLDGEGHIDFDQRGAKGGPLPVIQLAMTCAKTVEAFRSTFNLMPVWVRSRNTAKDHWKDCYVTKATTHKAAKICEALLPAFLTKNEVAEKISIYYIRDCEQCSTPFWSFSDASTCSQECFKIRKRTQDREYRLKKKAPF